MRLTRLAITHLPGIRRAFTIDGFGPGLTVVTGPNAAGKSSLVRALRHLIDESPDPDGGALTLEAELVAGDDRYRVTRSGSQVAWQCNGRPIDRPPLPRGSFLHCYWLSMDDLLEAGGTEQAISERLRRELSGGFDLDAVRAAAAFELRPRHGSSEARALQQSERELAAVVQRYEALEHKRAQLPALEARIAAAAGADAAARDVAAALDWLESRQALSMAVSRVVDEFPAGIERLDGHELTELEGLEQARAGLLERKREAERARADAEAALAASGLVDAGPSAAELDACRRHIDAARQFATRIDGDAELLDAAAAEVSEAAARLGAAAGELPAVDADDVDAAVRLAGSLRAAERAVAVLEADVDVEPVDTAELAARVRAADELRRWLRHPRPAWSGRLTLGGAVVFALAAAGLVWWHGLPAAGGAAGVLAYLPAAPPAVAAFVAALLAAAAAGIALGQQVGAGRESAVARARAAETGVALPAEFTPESVSAQLDALDEELAELRRRDALYRAAQAKTGELASARASYAALDRQRRALAERIGFDPAVTAESAARFLGLVATLDAARTKRTMLEARIARTRGQLAERLDSVRTTLATRGIAVAGLPATIADVGACLDDVVRRVAQRRDAQQRIDEASRTLARAAAELDQVDAAIDALYQRAGLDPGDRRALEARVGRFGEYQTAVRARDEAAFVERERRRRVDTDAELTALVERGDETTLRERLARLQAESAQLEPLHAERAALNAELDRAGRDHALAKARLARDRERDALDYARRQAMLAEAGGFLLDDVAAEHHGAREPAVLAAARERLRRYTHGRYDIGVTGDGQLHAHDTEHGTHQPLETLSTGTRMQLLMAVRLAWTVEMEKEFEPLPVFLDEALTTTDPERFAAVARSLADTAASDARQIVYLTSQPADVQRFEQAVGTRPAHVDLPRARFGDSAPPAADYAVAPPEAVPGPDGMSADAYAARLGVPAVAPREGAGAIHIFYLLRDDLPALHNLLQAWRVRHLGPLERLLASDAAAPALPDAGLRARLAARCRIARLWVDLWGHGRGRPVERNALEASGAVSEKFIADVSALAERVDGDADALLEALMNREVPRFQQNKIAELATWLEDHGYRDCEAPLSPDTRFERTLLAAGAFAPPDEIRAVTAALEAGLRVGQRNLGSEQ